MLLPYSVVYFLCLIFFVILLLCFDRNFDVFFMQIHSFELVGRVAKQNRNQKNKSYQQNIRRCEKMSRARYLCFHVLKSLLFCLIIFGMQLLCFDRGFDVSLCKFMLLRWMGGMLNKKETEKWVQIFSNFSCRFLNLNNFLQFELQLF